MGSFRLRIGLLSAVVAGAVVIAFGVSAWVLIRRANLERIDEELKARLLGFLATRHHSRHWTAERQADTDIVSEEYRSGAWILFVKDERGQAAFRSPTWPDALAPDQFEIPMPNEEGWDALLSRRDQVDMEDDGSAPPPQRRPGGPHPPFPGEPPLGRGPPHDFPGARPLPPPMPYTDFRFETCEADGQSWRVAATATPNLTMLLGTNLSASAAQMRSIRNAFLLALPVALLLVASGAMLIAKRALQPISRLTRAVESISASELAQRIPTDHTDGEFQRLITVFNAMMDRLERSFQQAARFSADAAHELNTPLTIVHGHLDCAIQGAVPGSEEQQVFTRLLEQVERLKSTVSSLLLIARADAGQLAKRTEWTDLSEMLGDLREDIEAMAPHLTVTPEVAPAVGVMADRHLLLRMLHNLASNAVKYNTGEGWIRIELEAAHEAARVTLSNSGPEIPEAAREQLFDRFFRVDPSRGNRGNSAGLGLSLAREIARAHGGDLVLKTAGEGVVAFELTLPAAPGSARERRDGIPSDGGAS